MMGVSLSRQVGQADSLWLEIGHFVSQGTFLDKRPTGGGEGLRKISLDFSERLL